MRGIHTILLSTTSIPYMFVCTAACGMVMMRPQQIHLDHDELIGLNISTIIENKPFLFRKYMYTSIDEMIIVQ